MGPSQTLVFIPAYNCAAQIERVVAQLGGPVRPLVEEVIVVDNRSEDDTVARATAALREVDELTWRVLVNHRNYGLGGSHKVAIDYGAERGFDWLLVLHGDDQADVDDIVPLLRTGAHEQVDALLGARFMRGSRLVGYSRVRTLGNHAYNWVFSLAGRRRLHDLGSGLNMFRLSRLASREHLRFADDLTFNYELILYMLARQWRLRFFPISWREEDQRSNVKLVRQGIRTLGIVGAFVRGRDRFFSRDRSSTGPSYTAETVAASNGSQ
jgi:dolichol-phosphate mannosyltransferase